MKTRTPRPRDRPAAFDAPADPPFCPPNAPAADPEPTARGAAAVVDAGAAELPEHLFRRLLGAYLAGAPVFELRQRGGLSAPNREVVRTFVRRTCGPAIVADTGDRIVLNDLPDGRPIPLERRLGRMGQMVLDLHRDAVASWRRLPLGAEDGWERRDDAIDREAWLLQRTVARRLAAGRPAPGLLGIWTVTRSLERIADHGVVLGSVGPRLIDRPRDAAPSTSLEQFHAQAMDHLEGVLAAADPGTANGLLDTGAALIESGRSLADRLLPGVGGATMPPATAAAIARVVESIGRTIAYAQDIAQVVLDAPRAAPRRGSPRAGVHSPVRPRAAASPRERFLAPAVA